MVKTKICPCGSGKEYEKCCKAFIEDNELPPTPEVLMRSRYTAYVNKNFAYIAKTSIGPAKHAYDENDISARSDRIKWLNLSILKISPINIGDNIGFVEFMANFIIDGKEKSIHEISEFRKIDNKWYYFDGKYPKVGRNEPCVCGSGKKYKKCCGKRA